MSFNFKCVFPVVVIIVVIGQVWSETAFLRPCYFTNWSQYREGRAKFLPENYMTELCTHIIYAFCRMNENFTVRTYEETDDTDIWWQEDMYARVNNLKKTDTQLKTLLSFGGSTFGTRLFKAMAKTEKNRAVFIKSAVSFVIKHNFDGIDIDWVNPKGSEDKENFSKFLKELRSAVQAESAKSGGENLLISAAVAGRREEVDSGYEVTEIAKWTDFVLVITYDFHNVSDQTTEFNSPLYSRANISKLYKHWNVAAAANYWHEKGMPKKKILVGIPTFGRGWTLENPERDHGVGALTVGTSNATQYVKVPGTVAYYEICAMLAEGAKRFWSTEQQVPYLVFHGDQWFSYDDPQSFKVKASWVKENGFGGAFVWALDFDDFRQDCSIGHKRYPLISEIAEEFAAKSKPIAMFIGLGASIVTVVVAVIIFVAFLMKRNQFAIQNFSRISKDQIEVVEKIGEGHFCDVLKAHYKQVGTGSQKRKKSLIVAVKVLKLTAGDREVKQFLSEAIILDKLRGQPNIIKTFGLCLSSRPNFLVLEFMAEGSLRSFLSKEENRNNITHKELVKICLDVNNACCVLEKMGYIHRDIAARNCLVESSKSSKASREIHVKLSDFGLAKDEKAIYRTPDPDLPVAWVAPEGFVGVFSIKSDIWAYGVLIWEVFTYGAEPYGPCSRPGSFHLCPCVVLRHAEIERHVCETKKTLLDLPDPCTSQFTDFLREIMTKCWNFTSTLRPSFEELRHLLNEAQQRLHNIETSLSQEMKTSDEHAPTSSTRSKISVSISAQGSLEGYNRIIVRDSSTESADPELNVSYVCRNELEVKELDVMGLETLEPYQRIVIGGENKEEI